MRQLWEKYLARRKNLYFAFLDTERAFDRVPRNVVWWWALRKLVVEEWLLRLYNQCIGMLKVLFSVVIFSGPGRIALVRLSSKSYVTDHSAGS